MSFYLSWNKASLKNDRYNQWNRAIVTSKLNYLLGIPKFDITNLPWIGASYIATEFWGSTGSVFSIRKPQINPADFNFFLCVRIPQRNNSGLGVTRYKLWNPTENVRLDTFPLYREERLTSDFVIEVWTLPSSTEVSIAEVEFLITSLIVDPITCCYDTAPVITLVEHCDIWAAQNQNVGSYNLPIQFNTCFNIFPIDTYYRVTELGEIRDNEIGDLRIYV